MKHWTNDMFIDKLKPLLRFGRAKEFLNRFIELVDDKKQRTILMDNTRQRGNTTWILESAISNPKVIIICRNTAIKLMMESRYEEMLLEKGFEPAGLYPIFTSLYSANSITRGYNVPIIFDLSCF